MRGWGLRGRLTLSFGVLLALQLAVAGSGVQQLRSLRALDEQQVVLGRLRADAGQWSAHTRLNVSRALSLAKAGSAPALATWLDGEMKQTSIAITGLQQALDAGLTSTEGKSLMADVGRARKAYVELRAGLLARLARPEEAEAAARDIDARLLPAAAAYLATIDAVIAQVDRAASDAERERTATIDRDIVLLPALAALALVLGALMAWLVARSVTRPVREAQAVATRIAHGDLTQPVPARGTDEIGQLLAALAAMQDSLRRMVGGIRGGTDSVCTATEQIAMGNQDLSARTERAASNLQQTAATLASLGQAMQECAGSAGQARGLADEALDVARRGGELVRQVAGTMAEIDAGSSRIGEITGVIDGIAFQTNMLALNAAVEAARAGEHGRGFGVVAAEVRHLSGRCAEAAREIRALIAASAAQVETGSRLAGDAGATMQRIEQSVQQVTHAIAGISSSTAGQATGVGEVNQAVAQLDEMTQQNASLVEEAAAAADSLKAQAGTLGRLVATFRLPTPAAAA
ncbi:MAG: methyl-accepting chemotaxis protein [Ramlibacter sp.]